MEPIIERSLHAVAIVLLLALGVAVLKWWQKRKAGSGRALLALEPAKPAVVYFHSPSCGVCRASQKPILDALMARLGPKQLQLVAVDVSVQAELARAWGVTTVPTTYVLGPAGHVAHVNNGVASEPTLRRQLSSLGAKEAAR